MDHALLILQPATGDERGGGAGDFVEAIPDVHLDNEVDDARFVFKRDERDSLRGPRPLANEHHACDTDNVSAPREWQLALRFNIAPTQQVAAVRQNEQKLRELTPMRWGLVPSWAKDAKIGNSLINARAETVAEKPAFRAAFKRRRCLIAADGYYEWKKLDSKTKQSYYIRRDDEQPFAFAGLWELWERGDEPIESCTIITTDANALTREVHDRMPVILPPDKHDIWLDSEFQGYDFLQSLLVPFEADELTAYPVSRIVNSPKNDSSDCIVPIPS